MEREVIRMYTRIVKTTTDDDTNLSCAQIVELQSDGRIEYTFFRPTPVCSDGYRYEMDEQFKEIGWKIGMGGMTYKDDMSLKEFLDGFILIQSYLEIYKENVLSQSASISLSISGFFGLVIERSINLDAKYKKDLEKMDVNATILMLMKKFGFVMGGDNDN